MGTPARALILADVLTTLESITVANGYHTGVVTVEAVLKGWDDIGQQQYPWVGYLPGVTRFEYQPSGYIRCTVPLMIVAHINAGPDTISSALSALEDDLIAALNADTTRSGNAVSTTIVSSALDDGDPDVGEGSKGGSGTIVMELDIVYFRTTTGA